MQFMARLFFVFLAQCAFFGMAYSLPAEVTASDAKALVERGLAHIKVVGQKKAYEDFSAKDGNWSKGELYIFVMDHRGVMLAHGANKALVGINMHNVKDANGKEFVKEFINVGKKREGGWVDYLWSNPVTRKIGEKTTFVTPVPDCSCFIAAGVYRRK